MRLGDKDASFVGSSNWIGAIELSYVLDDYLDVTCKVSHELMRYIKESIVIRLMMLWVFSISHSICMCADLFAKQMFCSTAVASLGDRAAGCR